MGRVKPIWYLSHMRAAKVQASLRIRAVSPEPPLLAHTSSESRGTIQTESQIPGPSKCAVKICHNGLLEDTNSLDGAHIQIKWTGKLKSKWLDHVKYIINSNGFGHIWNSSNEVNMKCFTAAFKRKLHDQYLQTWSSLVDQTSSGKNYRLFNESFKMNKYFSFLPAKYCRILTAFRTRNHRLPIE